MRAIARFWLLCVLGACVLGACGDDDSPPMDGGGDGSRPDAGSCVAVSDDFPAPVAGRCEAVVVDGEATLPVGDDGAGGFIAPGARRLTRLGTVVELPGFPMRVVPVPGTRYVLVTDGGVGDEALSVIDIDSATVIDQEMFRRSAATPESLFLGLAVSADGSRVWASGGGAERIWAFDFDVATGQLTRAAARDLVVGTTPGEAYVAGLRLLSDDRTLLAVLLRAHQLVVFDTGDGSESARVSLGESSYPYDVVVTPDDATAYISLWGAASVVPVELAGPTVGAPIAVGKNPEGLALSPDGSQVVVAGSDSDSLTVIDVATGAALETIWVAGETALRGASPSAGSFDGAGRLYVVNAGDNAVDVFEPTVTGFHRLGRIPTMWYPTDVHVLSDGTVLILNGKHVGSGPNTTPGATDILDLVGGSVTILAPGEITDPDLITWEIEVGVNNTRAARFSEVSCPVGVESDFPIPRPGEGPSPIIDHVIVLVRENKTYDAYLGDLTLADGTPHGNGDPSLTLIPTEEIEQVVPNTRELARRFAMGDNYHSLAEQSVQGHFWTTHGRTTDMVERSWLSTWGRAYWGLPPQGVIDPFGYPEEGSLFDYLLAHEVDVVNYGEVVGVRAVGLDPTYPGLAYTMEVLDIEKATYLGQQWRSRCRMPTLAYAVLPNDHTYGRTPGKPTPRSMIADNDEAIGFVVEAVSHSTYWPTTVIFVIEDDPQDGGDHMDNHRSPLLVISPWVDRGHVSSVHYNESSIFRTIQLILGIDEPLNAYWENAAPMFDLFTSTPDYTPYDHIPRRWPVEMNPDDGSSMAAISQAWDFSEPDEQPGLSRLLWRHLRGSDPPWPILPEVVLEGLKEQAEENE